MAPNAEDRQARAKAIVEAKKKAAAARPQRRKTCRLTTRMTKTGSLNAQKTPA